MTRQLTTEELVQAVMRDHGYANAQELSSASGVPYNTVYRWSTGASNAHRRSLIAFLSALDIDPADYGIRVPPGAVKGGDEPPAWFVDFEARQVQRHEQSMALQQQILDELDAMRRRRSS